MSGQHSIIPPSSAGIWGKPNGCTGWVLMNATYPEPGDSPEALDGEAAHEIAATLINDLTKGPTPLTWSRFEGNTATNGIVFTKEMYDAALMYALDVGDVMLGRSVFGGPMLGIEAKLKSPQIHELSEGTSDCFLFSRSTGELFIWDFKFGYLTVEAFENWQLIDYIAGIINECIIDGYEDQHITVHARVAQPRAFHRDGPIREWKFKLSDIRAHINTLHTNAHIALSNDAMLRTGDHCAYCTARHACKPALEAGVQLFEVAGRPVPQELPPDAMGLQLSLIKRAIKQLEFLESAYDEQVKHAVRGGVNVPGWIVEQGKGRERWGKPVAEVIALGNHMGVNLKKDDEAITPNQARQKGLNPDVIAAYSEIPTTGARVVPDNGNKAKQVFSK